MHDRQADKQPEKQDVAIAAEVIKRPELSNQTFMKLHTDITNIPEELDSYSLAVQIEFIFSFQLLQWLILEESEGLKEKAKQLLAFLEHRFNALSSTEAWHVNSRRAKLNQACWATAKCLSAFNDNDDLRKINEHKVNCEKWANPSEEDSIEEPVKDDEPIYTFIYQHVFAKQPVHRIFKYLPQKIKIAGSEHEPWKVLLNNILGNPNQKTFIQIVAKQVKRKDWEHFFFSISKNVFLFKLVLGLNVKELAKMYDDLPPKQKIEKDFDTYLFEAADTKLRERPTVMWGFFSSGAEGDIFKANLVKQHSCETQREVLALAYALFETYLRVRNWNNKQTSTAGKMVAATTNLIGKSDVVADKEDKVAACKILLKFCLKADSISEFTLKEYLEDQKQAGNLDAEKEKKFLDAKGEGLLKALFDAMCEISAKVPMPVVKKAPEYGLKK